MIYIEKHVEYSNPVALKGNAGRYFIVPISYILSDLANDKRMSVYAFFATRRGLDNIVEFSTTSIVRWLNKKPDNHKNGINKKIKQTIDHMVAENYIHVNSIPSTSTWFEGTFNLDKLTKECETERFAMIYLDEVEKIMNYNKISPKDPYMNNDILLLVFAYLRAIIYRRRNQLLMEEINRDNKSSHTYDIETRRKIAPEAYDCYYKDIADSLGLSERIIAKAISILTNLELIYTEALPRIKYIDGNTERWRTDHTIFCNTYKREGSYLHASGKEYYMTEIANKKLKLKGLKKGAS